MIFIIGNKNFVLISYFFITFQYIITKGIMTTICTSTPLDYLAEARQFLSENAALHSIQMNHYNINITTDWLHSLCSTYCELDAAALTKNADINTLTEFNLENADHVSEIQKYAYKFGVDSKFWEGTGCYTFPNFTKVNIVEQLQSSLNMFLIHVFMKDTKYKIQQSVIKDELDIVPNDSYVESITSRVLSKVGQFINVENTTDVINKLIQFGIFDKKVQTDFVYNGDRLTFPIHLKIKDDITQQEGAYYVLNLNLIQHCTTTRSFRVWIHSIWDQIEVLNDRISNLKCVIQCKSVECSTELDALNAEIFSLLQQLQSKNLTITNLESQLESDMNTVNISIVSLQDKIESLESDKQTATNEIHKLESNTDFVSTELKKGKTYDELLLQIRERIYPNGNFTEKETENGIDNINEQLIKWQSKLEKAQQEKERISVEIKSVKHRLDCTNLSLTEIQQKAERLKMKSKIVEQQQNAVQLQQNSLKIIWSKQNATIMQMCVEMDKCTHKLDVYHSQRNIEKESIDEMQNKCSTIREQLQNYTTTKHESDAEQLELLKQLDFVIKEGANLKREQHLFNLSIDKQILNFKNIKEEQIILKEEINTLETKDSSITVDIVEIQNEVNRVDIEQQKLRHEKVMMDIVVRTKLHLYMQNKFTISNELQLYNEYDQLLYNLIDTLMRNLERSEHTCIELKQRRRSLEHKIESMQTTIQSLKKQISTLKQSKTDLLNKIKILKNHLDENVVEKSEQKKYVSFLQHQIELLQLYNEQLARQQKIYITHMADIRSAADEAYLHPINPTSIEENNVKKERLQYLTHLEKLSSILSICKANYGIYRNLYDVYKLSEILKLCKRLIDIKLKVDKMNRTKYFGVGESRLTKMSASLDLTKFMKASTPAETSISILSRYFQLYFDRWRYIKWKSDGINRFPIPTEMDIMRFAFQMTIYRIQKNKQKASRKEKKT